MKCNDMTYIQTHAHHSSNFFKPNQLAIRAITTLLTLFLIKYHDLIPLINLQTKITFGQPAAFRLGAKLFSALAQPCTLAQNYLAPWHNCTLSNTIFHIQTSTTQSQINSQHLNKLDSLVY